MLELASLGAGPAGYLRKLPAPLAADCVNYGLKFQREPEDVGVLLMADVDGGLPQLRAATGPRSGRVWNSEITKALMDKFGDGRTGDWRVRGEFGKQVDISKPNTTLYARFGFEFPTGVAGKGDRLFATTESALLSIDISDPANPVEDYFENTT